MRKQQEKTDRLSLIILAAFLVLSTSHFMCRFDASGYIEGLFEKAWAGQVQAEAQVQPATAVVPAADALAAAPKVQTIARNPFMAPAAMLNKPTVHPGAVIGGGAPDTQRSGNPHRKTPRRCCTPPSASGRIRPR